MKEFKLKFSGLYRSRHHLNSGRIWQYRFWDHIIRNQDDMNRHIDYIHYNPVKHGLTDDPSKYEHSSISKFRKSGYYENDWGVQHMIDLKGEFGE